ncbi:MAG: heat-inducible transcription repressor HrcA [Candidatus Parcubacteria bacterium]|jgi:transcriptional regulator of heat shock response
MLDSRTSDVLAAAVREFIRTGEPVSSGHLYDRYEFGIKPAMIRLVLKDLDDSGYLVQPNYSAGRIPTDRGYEFYANAALRETDAEGVLSRQFMDPFARGAWPELLRQMSHELGLLSAATFTAADEVWKSGLQALVDRLDWESRSELRAVMRDMDDLDARIMEVKNELAEDDTVKIFIGRKSPVTRCEHLSVICGEYDTGGERMMLFAIGPKRMDYQRAAKVFKNLKVATKNTKQKTT